MESFDQLVDQYTPMIHKIIRSLHLYKNLDDFYQIGLISLWEASMVYDEKRGNFPSIAFKYIKGRLLQELNLKNKVESELISPQEVFWERLEDYFIKGPCEKEILLSYYGGLTENQTKWVLYTFMDDLTVVEIAKLEHVSPSAVKQWRKGAKDKLAENIRNLSQFFDKN